MWLKNCEDSVKESRYDALYNQRIRHIFPKSNASMSNCAPCCLIPSNYSSHIGNGIGFPMNYHQSMSQFFVSFSSVLLICVMSYECLVACVNHDEESKDENHMEPIVSSRWNPTPEQLMALEEMYRRGVRTPSAEEIKLIAAKLRQFGKIEGKNVFYWFQNHKARERQKRRRQPDSNSSKNATDVETLDAKETGFSCKALEGEHNKKLVTTIPAYSSTSKESVSMQRSMVTESGTDGWTHLDERELQKRSERKIAKGATSLMDMSCMAPNSDLLNTITAPSTLESSGENQQITALNSSVVSPSCGEDMINYEDGRRNHHTLQLFPLRSDDHCSIKASETEFKELRTTISSKLPPKQFYEFL
ncbi:uncharacterized protein [Coffea arabica]|uniref:Uncharacterized protein isoform X1 n=1 Tax=Coffea arabica TaxID=13443 RepID=A0A6P6VET1_COFAR|nr:protein WUSCHEL-like isoform X1 [Coffea arabica]